MAWPWLRTAWWWVLSRWKTLLQRIPFMNRSFVVLSSGRSGSELLIRLLNCHPGIACRGELLNRENLVKYRLKGASGCRLINYILARLLPLRPWFPYTGFKLFNEQLEYCLLSLGDVLRALYYPPVIVLYRENLLEQFVSLKVAFQTDVWYSEGDVNHCSIPVDWEELKNHIDTERLRWNSSLSELPLKHNVVFVSFEELAVKKQETASKLFAFLRLGSEVKVKSCSKRQNPLPLERKITNYHEILEQVARSGLDTHVTLQWLQECRSE